MRSAGGTVGIVPAHPLDVKGKTPLNLSAGLFAVTPRGVTSTLTPESTDRWKVEKTPARDVMQNQLAEASAPARVARTMASSGAANARIATGDGSSAIVYDRTERRFVNAENSQPAKEGIPGIRVSPVQNRSGSTTSQVPAVSDRVSGRERQREAIPGARTVAPVRTAVPPPSVPRSVSTERAFNGGGTSRGGSSAAGVSSPTANSASSSSASGARASSGSASSSGGGGGRPH
jgi:hypothetical protein